MGGCLSSKQVDRYETHGGSPTRGSPALQQSHQGQHRTHSSSGPVACVVPQQPTGPNGSPTKVASRSKSSGGDLRPEVLMAVAVSRHGSAIHRRSTDRASMHSDQSLILGTPKSSAHRLTPSQLVARANSRASTQQKKNSVGADLHSIMDDQGMLNPLVARQMSIMSHYSVRSESGSVLITPVPKSKPEFTLMKLIGRGGFGNVYLGEWQDGERVAVKIIQGFNHADQPDEQEWEARKERMAQMEAVLMSAIAHDNIVRTLKVIAHQGEQVDAELAAVERQLLKNHLPPGSKEQDDGPPSFEWHILMEYCDRGALSRALSNFMLHAPVDSHTVAWDAWASLEILKEVTRSLVFLHEHRILHGDLKAANVLLTSSALDRRKYIAKVSDFGLSRVLGNNKNHIKTQTFGTVTHVPPELLAKGTLSPKADVYAIGVLLWEIFTGEKVFKQLSDSEVILAVVTKKARPSFPPDVPSRFKFLAERCWSEMMELRPSLQVVMNELENLQKSLCPDGAASAPIHCKVFPSRQKALAEFMQKQKAAAAAREAAAKEAAAAGGSASPHVAPGVARSASQTGAGPSGPISALGLVSRTDSGAPSSMPRAPPAALRVGAALAGVGSARSPLSGPARDADRAGTGPLSGPQAVEVSPGSYNLPQAGRGIPGASYGSAVQLGARQNSSTTGASSSGHHPIGQAPSKHRSSAGRTLSPLAPQHAGSPERLNSELSVQRPAEPRGSREVVPTAQVSLPQQGSLSGLGPSSSPVPSIGSGSGSAGGNGARSPSSKEPLSRIHVIPSPTSSPLAPTPSTPASSRASSVGPSPQAPGASVSGRTLAPSPLSGTHRSASFHAAA